MGIAFHPDSELDDVKLTQLHEELLSKKAHFKDEIIKLNQVIAKKEDCSVTDVAEAANIREEADRAMGLVEQYTETLALIEKAYLIWSMVLTASVISQVTLSHLNGLK